MTNKKLNILPIVVMYLLFFMIAFVTNLCNPMAVIVKNNFDMSNFASQLGNAPEAVFYRLCLIQIALEKKDLQKQKL